MASQQKVHYVNLEPSAFLTDTRFITMTAAEKGLYWTVLLLLYENKGRIDPNDPGILRLVHWTDRETSFPDAIQDLHPSFYERGAWLRHRRVDLELKKAQAAIEQRVNAAKSRWNKDAAALRPHSDRIVSKGKEKKRKEKNRNEGNTPAVNPLSFDFIQRYDALVKLLSPRSKSDETVLRRIVFYIFQNDLDWQRVTVIANQSANANKPMAYFQQSIKSEYGDYRNAKEG